MFGQVIEWLTRSSAHRRRTVAGASSRRRRTIQSARSSSSTSWRSCTRNGHQVRRGVLGRFVRLPRRAAGADRQQPDRARLPWPGARAKQLLRLALKAGDPGRGHPLQPGRVRQAERHQSQELPEGGARQCPRRRADPPASRARRRHLNRPRGNRHHAIALPSRRTRRGFTFDSVPGHNNFLKSQGVADSHPSPFSLEASRPQSDARSWSTCEPRPFKAIPKRLSSVAALIRALPTLKKRLLGTRHERASHLRERPPAAGTCCSICPRNRIRRSRSEPGSVAARAIRDYRRGIPAR